MARYYSQSYQRYWWAVVIDSPEAVLPVDLLDTTDPDYFRTFYRQINENDIYILCKDLERDYFCKWWYAYHDEDTKLINLMGEAVPVKKTPHFHILLHFRQKITKTGVISALAFLLRVTPQRIDVNDIKSINSSLRYLVHYGDVDKFEYDPLIVKSNDIATFREALSLDIGKKSLTYKDLALRVQNANSLSDFGETLSLDDFRKYFFIIKSLFAYFHGVDITKVENISNEYGEVIRKASLDNKGRFA